MADEAMAVVAMLDERTKAMEALLAKRGTSPAFVVDSVIPEAMEASNAKPKHSISVPPQAGTGAITFSQS